MGVLQLKVVAFTIVFHEMMEIPSLAIYLKYNLPLKSVKYDYHSKSGDYIHKFVRIKVSPAFLPYTVS